MREHLLAELKEACLRKNASPDAVLHALEALLSWLVRPENNTDANCRAIDLFTLLEIWNHVGIGQVCRVRLPDSLLELLYDVGGQLHDNHTSPEIAREFESTPQQLLRRTRKLMEDFAANGGD